MGEDLTILVVDNHALSRKGIASLLSGQQYAILEAKTAAEAFCILQDLSCPVAVIVLAYSLPDRNAIEFISAILRDFRLARIILHIGIEDEHLIAAAIRAGARGVVCTFESPRLLVQALDAVLKGETYLSPAASRAVMRLLASEADVPATLLRPLSPAENSVLLLLSNGKSNKQIAFELNRSIHTVKTVRERIYGKLRAHSTAEAISAATRFRLLPTAD